MEQVFLQAKCPSCHPTSSVKALKETQQKKTWENHPPPEGRDIP